MLPLSSTPTNDTTAPETLARGEHLLTVAWDVHRLSDWVAATEIRGAGKRGKRCVRMSLGEWHAITDNTPAFEKAVRAVVQLAQRGASVEEMRLGMKWIESTTKLHYSEHTYRSVDITTPTQTVTVVGPKVNAVASPTEFTIACVVDTNNRPTLIQNNRTDPPRVFAWVKANAALIQGGMSFQEVWTALREVGTSPHYYCAMD